MVDRKISDEELQKHLTLLKGKMVSHPWKGYGSAIFLELGQLTKPTSSKGVNDAGEACITIEWDWRVESKEAVLFGSSNSQPKIQKGLETIRGLTIADIFVWGDIPELTVKFSNGYSLRSMVMVTGDPEWGIKVAKNNYIYPKKGELYIGVGGSSPPSIEEEAIFSMAREAAYRWGEKSIEPKIGTCGKCKFFVPIDGNGHLLEYGVCSSKLSAFDGCAVCIRSGCPAFM